MRPEAAAPALGAQPSAAGLAHETHTRAISAERLALLAVAAISLLALLLRFVGLGRKSVWFDEAVSAGFAGLPVPDLLRSAAGDVNPPLYYLLLHVWLPLAGTDDALLRLPSACFSAAAVGLTAVLGRALFTTRVGLVGALFTAVSAWHIDLAQEARGYGLLTCLAVASLLLLWRARQAPTWRRWIAFALVTTLALYTHNYGAFLLVAEVAYVVGGRALTLRAAAAFVLMGALFAAWLPAELGQLGIVHGDYWIEPPPSTVLADTYFAAIAYTPPAHGWGMSVLDRGVRWGLPVLLGLAIAVHARRAIAARARLRGQARAGPTARAQDGVLLLVLAVAVPVALPIAISMWLTPIYVTRYVGFAVPAFWLLVARGIDVVPASALRAAIACAVFVELCLSLPPLYTDPFYGRADLRGAAGILGSEAMPGALVVHASAFTEYPVAFYDRAALTHAVVADGEPAALEAATAGRQDFWYVREYNVQDPAASAAADEQARDVLDGRPLLRRFEAPGVHLYRVAAAPP